MNFLDVLNLNTLLIGLTNNTLGGIAASILVSAVVGGIVSLILLIGAWAEKSLKLFLSAIVLFCVAFISFYSTKTIPLSTEKIILRGYEKNTKEIKLNSTTVKGTERYFMVLTNKGTSFNINSDEVAKINSCDNFKYILTTTKYKFMIVGNLVESAATIPVIEVVCY